MPLHVDTPDAEGNLTDEQYRAAHEALRDEHGDDGLHIVPADTLAAAMAAAEARAAQ